MLIEVLIHTHVQACMYSLSLTHTHTAHTHTHTHTYLDLVPAHLR